VTHGSCAASCFLDYFLVVGRPFSYRLPDDVFAWHPDLIIFRALNAMKTAAYIMTRDQGLLSRVFGIRRLDRMDAACSMYPWPKSAVCKPIMAPESLVDERSPTAQSRIDGRPRLSSHC